MKAIASSSKIRSKKHPAFNAQGFLDSAGVARRIVEYGKKGKIYAQGDPTDHVMYIQEGGVRLSVVNEVGKEAVVAILAPGDFLVRGAWQVSLFEWGRRPRSQPRLYLLSKKKR